MSLKIALLTDFHYGFPEDRDMKNYFEPALEEMIESINEFQPEVVIGIGDYIQHKNREKDIEHLERLSKMLSDLRPDFYAITGNHDVENLTSENVINKLDAKNEEPYFSLELSEKKLIFLDTTHRNPDLDPIGGLLGEDQLEWLENEVDTEKDSYIFSHHLLHDRDLDDNWYFYDKPELAICQDKRRFNEIINDKNIKGVFSAHIHDSGLKRFKGIPHITMKAMDKYNPPDRFQKYMAKLIINNDGYRYKSEFQKVSV